MLTVEECVCCQEQPRVSEKREQAPDSTCITEHHGFEPVCLNEEVLATAYSAYKQQYRDHDTGNEYVFLCIEDWL